MKSKSVILGISAALIIVIVAFVYYFLEDSSKTLPKIKLSYFVDAEEISEAVASRLSQEIAGQKFFWIGMEPEKLEQVDVVAALKNKILKNVQLKHVIVDDELLLSKEALQKISPTVTFAFKENLHQAGEKLQQLEKNQEPYLFLTASIYTNSFLKENPMHKLKEKFMLTPVTFSLAFFPLNFEDEKNMLFPCLTEDKSGTADWGCAVANKARFTRRKIDEKNQKPWVGLMDLSGEKDYILLLRKK